MIKRPSLNAFVSRPSLNLRQRTLLTVGFTATLLLSVAIGGIFGGSGVTEIRLEWRNLPPSFTHLFGTDWLGRDMFSRTIQGLSVSIQVGAAGAVCSVLIAAVLGLAAATLGKTVDRIVTWLIDLFLSVPHLVALILIAFVLGGGLRGVIIGVALTHWPSLARIVRAEAIQLMASEFVSISRRLGRTRRWVATRHVLPHLWPQLLVGFLLLFPHAILHEAAITFIGLGLSPHQPAIGIILSESMRYLSTGMWWLAVFPGLGLLIIVRSFDRLGEYIRLLIDPRYARE